MRSIEPTREIQFAAKTGFITKEIWRDFFANGRERWQREYWHLLVERGFFRRHTSSLASDVLVLNRNNKDVRRIVGDAMSKHPFLATVDHDEIIARAMLELSKTNAIADYQTEAELNRVRPLHQRYRPIEEREKHPDALVQLQSGNLLALELELRLRSRRDYRNMLRTYRMRNEVDRIIFIVQSGNIFDSVREAMKDIYFSPTTIDLGFVWLNEWVANPSTARICGGTSWTSLEKLNARAA